MPCPMSLSAAPPQCGAHFWGRGFCLAVRRGGGSLVTFWLSAAPARYCWSSSRRCRFLFASAARARSSAFSSSFALLNRCQNRSSPT